MKKRFLPKKIVILFRLDRTRCAVSVVLGIKNNKNATDRMKQKRTTACRVWMSIAIMLATALGVRAQGNITLKLTDEPLPKALQLIEQQGERASSSR